MTVLEYFPGANTPKGFYSYYDYILKSREAKRIIVLKGGPGTGKSTFMKRIAKHLVSLGYETELLHCSSDPDSLDGVCAREIGFLILDGTAPHIVDPKCPGAVDEIINLGECWDSERIKENKTKIIETGERISSYFARAYQYLSAAKNIYTVYSFEHHANADAIIHELEKIKNTLKEKDVGTGQERKAFLSAVTPLGRINYIDTFAQNANYIYKIKSKNKKNADMFMSGLSEMLKNCGYDIRTFFCPMSPDKSIEHIYANGMFFTVENEYHCIKNADASYVIDFDKWNKCDKASADLQQYNMLLKRSEEMIKEAKKLHDELERYYVPYMDFEKTENLCDNVIRTIK